MATRKKTGTKQPTSPEAAGLAVGQLLLEGFVQELKDIKNAKNPKQNVWQTLPQTQQDEILDRFGRRITDVLKRGYEAILTHDVNAAFATLKKVVFNDKGVEALLLVPGQQSQRHALADFQGRQVLVVMADDLNEYLESMKNVKADPDQGSLLDDTEKDTRTQKDLVKQVVRVAKLIGEKDIDHATADSWDRDHLIDYIGYAEQKLSGESQTATKN